MIDGFDDPKVVRFGSFKAARENTDRDSNTDNDASDDTHPRALVIHNQMMAQLRSILFEEGFQETHPNLLEVSDLLLEMLDAGCSLQDEEIASDLLMIDDFLLGPDTDYSTNINYQGGDNWVDMIDDD